jgi:hypothetical protein
VSVMDDVVSLDLFPEFDFLIMIIPLLEGFFLFFESVYNYPQILV